MPLSSLPSSRPQVILFDVNETLLDMSKLKLAVNKAFGNKFAFKQWFGLLLQYSLVDTVTDSYHPFGTIGDAALDMAAAMLEEKPLKPTKKSEILDLMTQLAPHKDVPHGLEMLVDAGFRLVAFTNSPKPVLDQQLRHARIIRYFQQGLSIETVSKYKPHPETYQAALQTIGLPAAAALLVAAHGWDVAGAAHAGLQTGFIARPGQTLYPLAAPPTYTGKTLPDLVKQLLRQTE
ncbi:MULTISPECIES: haloacid dehalogenase type II [Hymenobacter]|uniref:2-haloacid dehalogenase n=1 Tax=Hymenobacter mucosus TaxID=1411120 RepID=A0A238WXC2_9BACT|nr:MULTISPECIES: haloacid dehalogenase type II [Hymenobacter]SNR51128.1 2-haloacid dehalogenase [Hymenobacter mucosus]